MKKVTTDYIDYDFKFKNINEIKEQDFYSSTYILLGRDNTFFQSPVIGNNSTELLKGLDMYVLHDTETPEYNTVVVSPGRCRITNLDTMETKLHFKHLQEVIPYNSSNLLSDGSTLNTTFGWIYVYTEFSDSDNLIDIKYSSVAPSRDKYGNEIKNCGERKTLYHPTLNARCIGTLVLGEYMTNSGFGDGNFDIQMIRNNMLVFNSLRIYNTESDSGNNFYLSDFTNETRQGGFPITAFGVTVTVAGGIVQIYHINDENDIVDDENIYKEDNGKYINEYSAYPSAIVDDFYFYNKKDLYEYIGGSSYDKYSYIHRIFINR